MKLARRGDKTLIRTMNRSLVLNLIHGRGPLSRTEIARSSGLGNATVSEISSELVATGLVEEVGEGESTGGRRPLLLQLNPNAGYVVGIKVMEQTITCALADLNAKVIAHYSYLVGADHSPVAIQTLLIETVTEALHNAQISTKRVLGIGIGLAGLIDARHGIVRYSPYFDWHDVDFAKQLVAHFDLPVYLENDVNTLTVAEQWFGHGRGIDNFVVVTVGRGIGSGIVMNGQFCREAAGEIGHLTMIPNGPRCPCGKQGCLEAISADPAVLRAVRERLAEGQVSVLSQSLSRSGELTLDDVLNAADTGDSLAIKALDNSGYFLGMGIANLVNLLSPQLVIVSGEGMRAGKYRIEAMQRAIREHVFNGLGEHLRLVEEQIGDETWARGAASLVLGEIFKSPVHGESIVIDRLLSKSEF